ncbi:MAG TPA: DUF5615 family PIN-like protein [Candidatus Nanoarchaeia archaeon]|nr:DUF5615 family PIN-like protein [Candidatus Nanoarchaeia archaeon]
MLSDILIYCDESVDIAVVEALKRRGINATSARDEGKLGLADEEQLKFAVQKKAVILTHDPDFLRLVVKKVLQHWGIFFAEKRKLSIGTIVRKIELFASTARADDLKNRIEFL